MIAFTRAVSPHIDRCELTHLERRPIDPGRAAAEHEAYEAALAAAGAEVRRLPPLPDHPDAVFVEDAAVVLDEVAILARPGAASRRDEVDSVAGALQGLRRLERIRPPATLDGGDVLRVGRDVWVGASRRTNAAAHGQLHDILVPLGYRVRTVRVGGCLHLKTAVTAVAEDTLLLNPAWVDPEVDGFERYRVLEVDPGEHGAANVVRIGSTLLVAAAAGATRKRLERLERLDVRVVPVEVSELGKAEAGLTCCSLLVEPEPPGPPVRG